MAQIKEYSTTILFNQGVPPQESFVQDHLVRVAGLVKVVEFEVQVVIEKTLIGHRVRLR